MRATPKSGELAAALLAMWLGMAALLASHLWSMAMPSKANLFLLKLAVWIPGWQKIGPFAGKETIGLIVWLGSWVLLFLLLHRRSVPLKPALYAFLAGVLLVTLLFWPPVIHAWFGWNPTTAS
ncbi:hypothetical protein [Paenibacillus koleovorans]|uniref:hypothetical protein n=1 Tax=Paenibacillus koleovorans TaxID=121608 RepID=UPI000FDB5E98|nr:hypothetical protein [Paenibacillus koleovorans]